MNDDLQQVRKDKAIAKGLGTPGHLLPNAEARGQPAKRDVQCSELLGGNGMDPQNE